MNTTTTPEAVVSVEAFAEHAARHGYDDTDADMTIVRVALPFGAIGYGLVDDNGRRWLVVAETLGEYAAHMFGLYFADVLDRHPDKADELIRIAEHVPGTFVDGPVE
ncbi:hypothetical protein [Yinghuangia seranimata]|uniref:hypothetical protein n=1 Tax=Yinghuangia seranimata TaxID=408067 RepID=UPI00248BBA3A|nr:hypothetical protein [Yinghuangia seranimata]MDI2127945.1 hypothetical protein [Yinghuangia seranimata]